MTNKFTLDRRTLEVIGLKDKDAHVYFCLCELGSAPLRRIAEESKMSRSTVHDGLRRLKQKGLVSFVEGRTHQYFTAEHPEKLRALATQSEVAAKEAQEKIQRLLPEIEDALGSSNYRPAVRYFEGEVGIKDILRDVLHYTKRSSDGVYRVYSSAAIRDLIASAWPAWNTERKRAKVKVRAISIGEGGQTYGLDERKWLSKKDASPVYIFIYEGRVAYVAASKDRKLFGVIIEDISISSTQKMIFESLWKCL
ncbi:hypothetical protein KKG22_05650 [Patescibacteria group bacterium]|nr:hypothetical protein [Patescibacteria group bacterium]